MTVISNDEIGHIYREHMVQARSRLLEVERQLEISDNVDTKKEKVFAAEYCYLQLRSVVELVSIAILSAHNAFEEFRGTKLLKEYNPNALLRLIGQLHPAAFPHRGFQSHGPDGLRTFFAMPIETLEARDRLSRIYVTACDKLHFGALKSVLKRDIRTIDFNNIQDDWAYLVDLLREHVIVLPDNRIVYCKIDYPNGEGIVLYWITLPPDTMED